MLSALLKMDSGVSRCEEFQDDTCEEPFLIRTPMRNYR